MTKQSSTSNISNVIGGRFPPPPPAGVCGLVTARSKPTVTQILATRGSSDDYFWRHVKKIPQYSDCVIELLSSNDMQLSDNVICEVSKVQNAIDRFDKLSPCLQDILLPRLISQVTELSSFYSNTSQSQQHASTETDKNVSIASNTTRADLDALECLGKRGRYYYDVRPEEEYLGGGIEVLAGGGEGEGGDTTTLTEISRNENKVLTSRHGGLLSTSWHDLLNGYNDDHDGSYLESFIDKSCLRARNLRYKKVKKTNNAIEVEKETNRVMFPIVVPVPVSVCHPASWGPNTRRDRDATRAIPVSIIHPACVSRTILYPPCSSRYLDNSHDSAGGAEVDDMYLEYIHSREMLAAQSAINCCNIAQLLSCCEREETIKKLKDRRDVLYNHAINAERFLRTLPGGSLATCSKKKTRESSKRAAVETTVIPSSTPVSSSDNLQNRVGACRVEWLEDPLFLRNLSVGMRVEVCLKGNTWTLAEVCIVHVDAQANPRSVKVIQTCHFHSCDILILSIVFLMSVCKWIRFVLLDHFMEIAIG